MHRLLYIILYPILWLISMLPMRLLYLKSSVLYLFAFYIIRYRKKVVNSNLLLAFPYKTVAERLKISKLFYKHFCDLIFESIKSMTVSEAEMKERIQVTNLNILETYYNQNRSILLMAGHYANWEWSSIINKLMPHEGLAVYKQLDNPYFDALMRKIRSRFGASVVTNKKIVTVLFRKFKKNICTLTFIISDQSPKMSGFKHKDLFMGIDVPVFTGTEELAKKLDFSALYLKTEKIKRGYYEVTLVPLADDPKEVPDFEITRRFLDELEKQIKEAPQYYLWTHKRWKYRTT